MTVFVTTSTFSWLAHDEAERQRMLGAVEREGSGNG